MDGGTEAAKCKSETSQTLLFTSQASNGFHHTSCITLRPAHIDMISCVQFCDRSESISTCPCCRFLSMRKPTSAGPLPLLVIVTSPSSSRSAGQWPLHCSTPRVDGGCCGSSPAPPLNGRTRPSRERAALALSVCLPRPLPLPQCRIHLISSHRSFIIHPCHHCCRPLVTPSHLLHSPHSLDDSSRPPSASPTAHRPLLLSPVSPLLLSTMVFGRFGMFVIGSGSGAYVAQNYAVSWNT